MQNVHKTRNPVTTGCVNELRRAVYMIHKSMSMLHSIKLCLYLKQRLPSTQSTEHGSTERRSRYKLENSMWAEYIVPFLKAIDYMQLQHAQAQTNHRMVTVIRLLCLLENLDCSATTLTWLLPWNMCLDKILSFTPRITHFFYLFLFSHISTLF